MWLVKNVTFDIWEQVCERAAVPCVAVARAAAADVERAVAHARPLQVAAIYHQNYYHHHHHNHNYRHHSRHHVYHDGCRRGLLWILTAVKNWVSHPAWLVAFVSIFFYDCSCYSKLTLKPFVLQLHQPRHGRPSHWPPLAGAAFTSLIKVAVIVVITISMPLLM
jgi:hypothetical protein